MKACGYYEPEEAPDTGIRQLAGLSTESPAFCSP